MTDCYNVISTEIDGAHSWLLEYFVKCKSGEIIVGHEMLQALDRHYTDIWDSQYRFELSDAHKRIRFIETKLRLFEAPHAGEPFILLLWEKAYIEALYSFKQYDEELGRWVRKYQESLLLVGRKNGKTPFTAAILLAEYFCGPMGLKIMCASNNYDQADLIFQAINNMREESPSLERVTRKNQKGIFFGNQKQRKKRGKFTRQNKAQISKISKKTANKEGRNLGVAAVDEVHEMEDNSLVMPLIESVTTQDEPLYFEITTEGFVNDGYLDHRLADARSVLAGEMEQPRWLIWLYTQDSEREIWQNEESWNKSNPSLGPVKKWSALRKLVEKAKRSNVDRAYILSKEFNLKQNNAQAWVAADVIENPETFSWERFRGAYYIGGIDVSETTDLTSARALFVGDDGRKYVLTMYFIPESKADAELDDDNRTNPEKKNYREWAKKGLVQIIPGNEVDTSKIVDWYWSLYQEYQMKPYRIGYDLFDAKSMAKELAEKFGEEVPVRVRMKPETLSNPMRTVEADLESKDLIYHSEETGRNEIDIWCLENTSFKLSTLGLIMPVKVQGQSKRRIDGTLTMIICYCVFAWVKKDFLQLCKAKS